MASDDARAAALAGGDATFHSVWLAPTSEDLRLITVSLPADMIHALDALVKMLAGMESPHGRRYTRSAYIEECLRDFHVHEAVELAFGDVQRTRCHGAEVHDLALQIKRAVAPARLPPGDLAEV